MLTKALLKVIERRTTIPILSTICVKDGVAIGTDMDCYVHVPAKGIEGGKTYHTAGFEKGIFIDSELPVHDFPEITPKGDVIGRTTLKAEHLDAFKWVMLGQSKEETRYYLNGVYFDKDTIVSTDGHRLHSFSHETKWGREEEEKPKKGLTKSRKKAEPAPEPKPEVKPGSILPSKACALMMELVKETKAKEVTILFHDNLKFTINVGEAMLEGKLIDGTFPDWRRVVPKKENLKGSTTLNNAEIKTIIPQLGVIAKISGNRTASLAIENGIATPSNNHTSKKMQWNVSAKIPFRAGFNVKYLNEVGSGVLEYIDSSSPFKITDRRGGIDRMAVLMPLRV